MDAIEIIQTVQGLQTEEEIFVFLDEHCNKIRVKHPKLGKDMRPEMELACDCPCNLDGDCKNCDKFVVAFIDQPIFSHITFDAYCAK